jgi:hypothetical protein
MIPVGYMAKRVSHRPEWLNVADLVDVCSVSDCVSDNFFDYEQYCLHNGWWFFDSAEVILRLSLEHSVDLHATSLFYYEVYELEFDDGKWRSFSPEVDSSKDKTGVILPSSKELKGFDVVTFGADNSFGPDHSPLSCNSLAETIQTNSHCLLDTFEQAQAAVETGQFSEGEPGALRIFAVFSVEWSPALTKS